MQQDMKCDVTCCTVTSASLPAILCLASGRSEDTRFTDKRMEQHPLLIQWSEGRFTPLALLAVAIPTLVTITSTMEQTHRGVVLGILVAVVTLPGLIAP